MVMGAPLEDARHLAQRYDRMRQEAEAQVVTSNYFTVFVHVFPESLLWLFASFMFPIFCYHWSHSQGVMRGSCLLGLKRRHHVSSSILS